MIIFDKVNFTYQSGTPFSNHALFDVDITIVDGSYTAVIGHTGSGKSTLMQHLNGLLQPTEGVVNFDFKTNIDTSDESINTDKSSISLDKITITADSKQKEIKPVRRKVGLVFQFPETQLFEETVLKDVAFGPQNFGVSVEEAMSVAREKLKQVGIPEELHTHSPFELSGGQMRRVAIAGILAMEPEVLVLDEPTAGLDPKARIEMMELFNRLHIENGLTVVLVTHLMDDVAKYADMVYLVEKGKVISSGKPYDVFQDTDFLKSHALGVPKATHFALLLRKRGLHFDRLPITQRELVLALTEGNVGNR